MTKQMVAAPGVAKAVEQRALIGGTNILQLFQFNPRTRYPAVLVRRDGSENPAIITEFTRSGFRLVVVTRPELGEEIQIRVAGQRDAPGKIRWAHGEEAGGSF